jgi:succinate-semialdehyde dehydrogenase/glutarate-semialdehyde dehydrogenase
MSPPDSSSDESHFVALKPARQRVIADVTTHAALSCEETFGPVAGIVSFRDEAGAIRLASDTPYGPSAPVISVESGTSPRHSTSASSTSIPASTPQRSRPSAG